MRNLKLIVKSWEDLQVVDEELKRQYQLHYDVCLKGIEQWRESKAQEKAAEDELNKSKEERENLIAKLVMFKIPKPLQNLKMNGLI